MIGELGKLSRYKKLYENLDYLLSKGFISVEFHTDAKDAIREEIEKITKPILEAKKATKEEEKAEEEKPEEEKEEETPEAE